MYLQLLLRKALHLWKGKTPSYLTSAIAHTLNSNKLILRRKNIFQFKFITARYKQNIE